MWKGALRLVATVKVSSAASPSQKKLPPTHFCMSPKNSRHASNPSNIAAMLDKLG